MTNSSTCSQVEVCGHDSLRENPFPKRISFIDQCKGIGIMLMVYGHCITDEWITNTSGASYFSSWMDSFHMPLFFVVGGVLLAYKQESFSFPRTLTKKARQLLLPGFVFSLLTIAVFGFIKAVANRDYAGYIAGGLFETLTLQYSGAMWFLPCYFFAEVIFLILMKRTVVKRQSLVISLASFLLSIFALASPYALIRISRLFMGICYIGIGYYGCHGCLSRFIYGDAESIEGVDEQHEEEAASRLKRSNILIGLLLLVLGGIGSFFNGKVGMYAALYGNSPLWFVINAMANTSGLVLIFTSFERKTPVLEFYGRNSLIVLCTHMFYVEGFWLLNSQIFHLPLQCVDARIFALGVILIEAPTILVVGRYFPWAIGQRKQVEAEALQE